MIAVIDIGTNTIRGVKLDGSYELENYSERSAILENTKDGILTKAGIDDLTDKLKALMGKLGIKPYVFATSAFRSLENQDEVCTYIKEALDLDIDVLSGEEEAECDWLSMKCKMGAAVGIGADLGGGSCQLFAFDGGIIESKSLPIGVKRLQKGFVSSDIPTKTERKDICEYLKSNIDFKRKADTLYIMGGTARAVLKLTRTLTGKEISRFSVEKLQSIAHFAFDSATLRVIKNILPKRYDSIGIGIDVICLVANKVGAKCIQIVDCSVREGYLIKKMQENP